jgi:hypothetical protein
MRVNTSLDCGRVEGVAYVKHKAANPTSTFQGRISFHLDQIMIFSPQFKDPLKRFRVLNLIHGVELTSYKKREFLHLVSPFFKLGPRLPKTSFWVTVGDLFGNELSGETLISVRAPTLLQEN